MRIAHAKIMMVGLVLLVWLQPREARLGTYSAYARFFEGYAITADISVGSIEPHEEEGRELAERQARLARLLGPDVDAYVAGLVHHYLRVAHPYRRYLKLVRVGPGRWKAPEEMWASELITHSTRIPLPRQETAQPKPDSPGGPALPEPALSAWPRPESIDLCLYLTGPQPYHLRSVLIGHLVASQLAAGGLLEHEPQILSGGKPFDLRDEIQAFLEERNSHSLIRLFTAARASGPALAGIGASARAPGQGEPGDGGARVAACALILKAALEQKPLGEDFAALAARLGEDHRVGLLLAILTPDDQWDRVRARSKTLLARLELP